MSLKYNLKLTALSALLMLPNSFKRQSDVRSLADSILDELSVVPHYEKVKSHSTALMVLVVAFQDLGDFKKATDIAYAAYQNKEHVHALNLRAMIAICHSGGFSAAVSAHYPKENVSAYLTKAGEMLDYAIEHMAEAKATNKRLAAALGTRAFLLHSQSKLLDHSEPEALNLARLTLKACEQYHPNHHEKELVESWPGNAADVIGTQWNHFVRECVETNFAAPVRSFKF